MSRFIDKKNGEARRKKAYTYLVNKGLKPHQAAGVLGNLMQESYDHLDSTVVNEIGAVGIAQWLGERKQSLLKYAKDQGTAHTDFDTQLDFLWNELNSTGNSWNKTKDKEAFFNSSTAEEAADIFGTKFERSGEKPGDDGYENRVKKAKRVYLQYNDKGLYAKNENGQVVNINPETATAEQRALSPKIKAEFYENNFDILNEKASGPKAEPSKAEEEALAALEAKKKVKDQREEFIKELNNKNKVTQAEAAKVEEMQPGPTPDPYAMDISTPANEFFNYFIPETMQEGGGVGKLNRVNLENNPNQLEGESDESYAQRSEYNAWRRRQAEDKNPLKKFYNQGKDLQSSIKDPGLRAVSEMITSPVDLAKELSDKIDVEGANQYKSDNVKSEDWDKAGSSAFDSTMYLFRPDMGAKALSLKTQVGRFGMRQLMGEGVEAAIGDAKDSFQKGGEVAPDLKYDKFLFDTEGDKYEQQRIVDYKKKFGQINNVANGSCIAGALNCNTDLIAPQLGLKPVRAMIEDVEGNLGKYKIPSQNYLDGSLGSNNFIQNNSIDAWETHQMMRGEGIGSDFFTADENTKYKGSLPEGMDYSSIPIGSIIGQGNSKGFYTEDKYGDRNRHGMTVSGYDKDGMPMVYDSGKFVRLDKLGSLGTNHKVTHITVPKGYEGYDFKKVSTETSDKQKSLGLDKFEPVKLQSNKPTFKAMEGAINEVKNVIAKDYSVPQSAINKLASAIPGMGFQETKLDSTEGISKSIILDTVYGNASGKMHGKTIDNMTTAIGNIFRSSDKPRRQDYQLEIEAYKKFPKDEKKRNAEFKRLAKENEGYDKPYRTDIDQSSKGPFAIKDFPEYATTRLGIKPGDMYGMTTSSETELANGSKVALTYLAENYENLKSKYKDLTEDQLVNLTLVSYNNKGKSEDPEFIKYYIKGNTLRDDYLDKVRNYKPED